MQTYSLQPEPVSEPHLILYSDQRKIRVRALFSGITAMFLFCVWTMLSLETHLFDNLLYTFIIGVFLLTMLVNAWIAGRLYHFSSKQKPILVINRQGILLERITGWQNTALPWSEIESISLRTLFSEKSLRIRRRNSGGVSFPSFFSRTLDIQQIYLERSIEEILSLLSQTYSSELSRYNVQV